MGPNNASHVLLWRHYGSRHAHTEGLTVWAHSKKEVICQLRRSIGLWENRLLLVWAPHVWVIVRPSTSVCALGQVFFSMRLYLCLISPCSADFRLLPAFFPLLASLLLGFTFPVNPVYFIVHCFPLRTLASMFLGSLPCPGWVRE